MKEMLRRRRYLRLAGSASILTLSGCGELEAALGTRTETLRRVQLQNSVSTSFDVRLEVRRGDEVVYDAWHYLPPTRSDEASPVIVDEWEDDRTAREWTVRAKTAVSDWEDATLDAARDVNCHWVEVETGDWSESPILVFPHACEENT